MRATMNTQKYSTQRYNSFFVYTVVVEPFLHSIVPAIYVYMLKIKWTVSVDCMCVSVYVRACVCRFASFPAYLLHPCVVVR